MGFTQACQACQVDSATLAGLQGAQDVLDIQFSAPSVPGRYGTTPPSQPNSICILILSSHPHSYLTTWALNGDKLPSPPIATDREPRWSVRLSILVSSGPFSLHRSACKWLSSLFRLHPANSDDTRSPPSGHNNCQSTTHCACLAGLCFPRLCTSYEANSTQSSVHLARASIHPSRIMADTEPTLMSGGQGNSTDAVEMTKMDPSQPSVPVKDDHIGADESDAKGKERQVAAAAAASSNRQEQTDSLSIGAADSPATHDSADGLTCQITLLLPTGARHPYKIDHTYLTKRNVDVPEVTESGKKDPFSVSVYKLKELILREWRDEWDGKPASPSSIRLIHFGKLLDDKEPLKST